MRAIFFYLIMLLVLVAGCGVNSEYKTPDKSLSDITFKEYEIHDLPYEEKPYIEDYVRSMTMDTFDQDSVPMIEYGGERYYHPVYASMLGIRFIDGAIRDGDPDYLKLAKRIANRMVKNSREANNKFLFPYQFDYTYSSGDLMESPWYSGMAQGRLLTLFTRLYNVTGEERYLNWADSTFESLKLLKNNEANELWVSYVDKKNYFWIEEYPVETKPVHVLNGFIYATFGLYDYYLATEKEDARRLLNASITTVEHYIEKYRKPGGVSYYNLKNKPQNEFYHEVHIMQLKLLSKITGEEYFREMAERFEKDYQSPDS